MKSGYSTTTWRLWDRRHYLPLHERLDFLQTGFFCAYGKTDSNKYCAELYQLKTEIIKNDDKLDYFVEKIFEFPFVVLFSEFH